MATPGSGSLRSSLVGGVLAAFGATACCFGPLALVTLGASGVWAARLQLLEPLQPLFIALALFCFGFAFYRLYIRPRRCSPDEVCALQPVLRRQRLFFWLVAIVASAMLAFP